MPIRPERKALYPKDWDDISLRIREERAGWRCECEGQCRHDHGGRCTAVQGMRHPVTGSVVRLTTAHLDRHPPNVADTNLRAMCQRCHLSYDAEQHAANASHTRAVRRAAGMAPLFEEAPVLSPCTAAARCSDCRLAELCEADGQNAAANAYRLRAVPHHTVHGHQPTSPAVPDPIPAAALAVLASLTTATSEGDTQ